jgi:hypothetical protein
VSRDTELQTLISIVFKNRRRGLKAHFVCSLLTGGWTDLRPPPFVLNIHTVNKTSIFCSEYSFFVVGTHSQPAN